VCPCQMGPVHPLVDESEDSFDDVGTVRNFVCGV
jgi:hypothetical protein